MPQGKPAILTVALNAAIDLSYIVEGFAVGKINTVGALTRVAGGKANNVARVLAGLGQSVIATGFAGGNAGRFIQDDLARHGIRAEFEESEGENRTCTAVVDPAGQTLTEIREKGPVRTEADAERFLARFRRLLGEAELVIISGSLPPGLPGDFYRSLVGEAWRLHQTRTMLDASGTALREALAVQPYLVKPNLEELEEWTGRELAHDHEILAAARELNEAGPLVVAVSLGARGLMLVSPEGAWRAVPPEVQAVNTVGSGDSLVAGFAAGLMQGLPADELLRLAIACGTANALTSTVAEVRAEDLARIRPQVRVERIG